ncbi:MAG: hypothetical protein AAB116_14060, partial [Candidatus Poribacteria bacterium]
MKKEYTYSPFEKGGKGGFKKFKNIIKTCLIIISIFIISLKAYPENKVVSLSEKTDEIIGKNYVNPYQLQYLPIIPLTEKIYLDKTLLLKDVDYSIDYNLGQISIKNLSGQNEKIKDESVIKIDYRIIPITLQKIYQRKLFEPQSNPPLSLFGKGGNETFSFGKGGMKKQGIGIGDLETIPSDLTFTGT